MGQLGYPLNDEEIKTLGGYVAKEPETNAGDIEMVKAADLPETIAGVGDDILNKAILCETTGRPFRIIGSELEFYRRMSLPLPTVHPSVRMETLFRLAPDGKKYKVICAKCGNETDSMFNPKDGFILYCDNCFKQEVY